MCIYVHKKVLNHTHKMTLAFWCRFILMFKVFIVYTTFLKLSNNHKMFYAQKIIFDNRLKDSTYDKLVTH